MGRPSKERQNMWRANPDKKLVLEGKFKELFLKGVYSALDLWFLEGDRALDEYREVSTNDFCSKPYADLSGREKLWALAEVTRCLTTKCETPELLQWNESAVYAVFEVLNVLVTYEIDMEPTYEDMIEKGEIDEFDLYATRKLVSEAQREVRDYDLPEDYVDPKSDDIDEWERVITDDLAEIILWDDDFLECNARIVCDKSPERAEMVKYMAGIPRDYYSTPIPLVTDEMLKKAKRFLRKTFKALYSKK